MASRAVERLNESLGLEDAHIRFEPNYSTPIRSCFPTSVSAFRLQPVENVLLISLR